MKPARDAMRSIILGWAIALYVTPSAASTTKYYVIVDPVTQLCTLEDTKPKDPTRVVVTMSSLYIGREEAERGLKNIIGCTNYRARGA